MNLSRLETLNSLAEGMMSVSAKSKHEAHLEQAILTGHVIENNNSISMNNSPHKEKFRRNKLNNHVYDNISSSPILPSDNYHQEQQKQQIDGINSSTETPPPPSSSSSSLIKQRRSTTKRPSQITYSSNNTDEKIDFNDKVNIVYVDEDSPDIHEIKQTLNTKTKSPILNGNEHPNRPSPKLETFL